MLMCLVGGGDIKIESHKVNFKDKAHSKVGSLDNVSHAPGGGNVKVRLRKKRNECDIVLFYSFPCSMIIFY